MQVKAEAASAIHVGIDVSKAHLDVHLHPLGERLRVSNDARGHIHLAKQLRQHPVALVLMEPTARYHCAVHRQLHDSGVPVALANPLRALRFAQACGTLAKTDAIDAAMLAHMAERLEPDPVAPPTPAQAELQELTSARRAAIDERTALTNQCAAATGTFLRRELANRLRTLGRHIARLDARIETMIRADPELDRKARILRSIPGVRPVVTLTMLALLSELGRVTARQAAALAGLAPFAHDSGTSQPKRRIHGGRAQLPACSTWQRSSPAAAIPTSNASTRASLNAANPPSSRSPPLPERSSSWQTRSSPKTVCGPQMQLDRQDRCSTLLETNG